MSAASLLDLNNLGLGGEKPLRCLLVVPSHSKEGTRSETAANDKPAHSVRDVNQPVDDFDLWHFFKQNSRVKVLTKHTPSPYTLVTTEQLGNEPDKLNERKPEARVFRGFLSTVSFARQITASVAASNPVGKPTPANDNDGWHPLDAA